MIETACQPIVRSANWIQTFTGRMYHPGDPRPEDVCIEDIAHSLSMQCRYTGHCKRFYSVAEHSVLVSDWVLEQTGDAKMAFIALLHDASEAYLCDVARPVKPLLSEYKAIEILNLKAIGEAFGVELDPMPAIVKEADDRILTDERMQNMSAPPVPWSIDRQPLGVEIAFLLPVAGEIYFMERFDKLSYLMGENR